MAGSMFPACSFDALLNRLPARSAFGSSTPPGLHPNGAASSPQPVTGTQPGNLGLSSDLHSPFGDLSVPLRIEAFNPIRYREARLPDSPDRLSLPATDSF